MGVYIKGMEMPKDCLDCPYTAYVVGEGNTYCRITGTVLARDFEVIGDGYKPEDCPIVPVPPHGRLGDLDKLADNMRSATAGMEHRAIIMHEIRRAPTIIPADDPKEET